ncbi:hypothetical protein IQ273_08895 [Nodosilinea sp. LEGE 07298]|uniref:hypothetical protein n=1 Tax=Nodosilinea sp. LEGE 07298 TaxID=2777970 RepID=UPI001880E7D0|nr:hypothetical protein [Nodosilinea sp. LEGE 07298]MBE9109531.1 hypothetical protein [Nodosilinea sp. LEGE 07298]
MNSPTQRRRPNAERHNRQRPASRASRRPIAGLWLLCGLLYAAAGMILTALAGPWVWAGAALGAVIQAVTLAGPEALQRFRWLTANLLVLGSIIGGTALAAALSIALNHLGTDNLDDLTLGRAIAEVVLYSLLAVGLAVLCSLATAALGDRLLRRNKGHKTSLILVMTALVGLAVGGGIGLLIA